jgi:HlyD family secretion protein/adhesin transport system membrane fusion protein
MLQLMRTRPLAVAGLADDIALPLEIEVGHWPATFRTILGSVALVLLLLLLLAAVAPVRELAVAEGQIVPDGSTMPIQHLEGGIVGEILIKPGQLVEAGQVMIRMEPTIARSDLAQLAARRTALAAGRIRLTNLLADKVPDFSVIGADATDIIGEQRELYRRAHESLSKLRELYHARLAQRQADVAAARAELSSLNVQLTANFERLALREKLMKEGYASKNAYLETKVLLEQTRARVAQVNGLEAAGLSAETEVQSQLADAEATKRVEWSTELAKVAADLAETEELLAKGRDRAERVSIVAPTKALVLEVLPKSAGEVLKPGDVAVSVVPLDGPLVAEVRLRPEDAGYIHDGVPARVKLSAFDPETFGPIDGHVLSVSPTTFRMEKGEPYYRVRLSLSRTNLKMGTEQRMVLPGMVVRAEIVTGEKSVLRYLLKPIYRSLDLVFSER